MCVHVRVWTVGAAAFRRCGSKQICFPPALPGSGLSHQTCSSSGQRPSFRSLLCPQRSAPCLAHSKRPLPECLHKRLLYTGSKLNCLNNSSDDIIPLALGACYCLEIKPLPFKMSLKVLSDLLPDLIFELVFCYFPAPSDLS